VLLDERNAVLRAVLGADDEGDLDDPPRAVGSAAAGEEAPRRQR
jgi:hypothetical protein